MRRGAPSFPSRAIRAAVAAAFAIAAAWGAPQAGADSADADPGEARSLLARAFANRYDVDTRGVVEITVRNTQGEERRRRLEVATKRIGGRFHSIGRFTEPEYLRGTAILNIENIDRSNDHFVYLPTLQRVRRLSVHQRADTFMGTDLTYEDFERRRIDEYEVRFLPPSTVAGEVVHVLEGRPRFDSGYARAEFSIASGDGAILETRYYKRGSTRPFKVLHAPRTETRRLAGHSIPTHLVVENRVRRTVTEVWIEQLAVNPPLDDGLFTSSAIEVGRPIPGLGPAR